ncbi:hypothetical protein M422DRAFT_780142 [Sphaerobolus stellatus SS14]|uniref:Uncharacterized protein n=1 Tax=Sphaerobolus stellatus (strain SS14) TaxID=990650 RepID=A0A0C9UG04_SPHS4|nr:hypothetical protein M422DRAFT_780142 [Sphaerobolus stellatus SS14]
MRNAITIKDDLRLAAVIPTFFMTLSPDKVLAEAWVDALFLGIYLTTFVRCLRWLVWADEGWKLRKKINWTMLIITLLISGCIFTNMVVFLQSRMESLRPDHLAAPPSKVGTINAPTWVDIVICTNANMTTLFADAVLILRLWQIYGKSLRVAILPILLWLGAFACTILQAFWQTVQERGIQTAWHPINTSVGPGAILTPFWGATMLLNMYATPMIALRIWQVTKKSEGDTSIQSLRFVMRVLIESGFMYVVVTTSHFVVWWTPNSYAIAIISAMNTPMTGIGFNLILIRTAEKKAENELAAKRLPVLSTLRFNVPTLKTREDDPSGASSMSESTAV